MSDEKKLLGVYDKIRLLRKKQKKDWILSKVTDSDFDAAKEKAIVFGGIIKDLNIEKQIERLRNRIVGRATYFRDASIPLMFVIANGGLIPIFGKMGVRFDMSCRYVSSHHKEFRCYSDHGNAEFLIHSEFSSGRASMASYYNINKRVILYAITNIFLKDRHFTSRYHSDVVNEQAVQQATQRGDRSSSSISLIEWGLDLEYSYGKKDLRERKRKHFDIDMALSYMYTCHKDHLPSNNVLIAGSHNIMSAYYFFGPQKEVVAYIEKEKTIKLLSPEDYVDNYKLPDVRIIEPSFLGRIVS